MELTKQDYQISFVQALRAIDDEYMEKMYRKALRDIAETVLDVEFDDENNEENGKKNCSTT